MKARPYLMPQKGFTLIELMISLTLGLVIMLAAVQLFITNQMGFNLQRGMGNVQENGRFALDYINASTRNSEYSRDGTTSASDASGVITEAVELPGVAAAANLVSSNNLTTLGVGSSDQLVIRQWISDSMPNFRDCEGNSVASGRFVVSRYFVRADTAAGSPAALACDAGFYADGAASVSNYGDSGVVLLSTIDTFQILFGIADTPTPPIGQRVPVRYLTVTDYMALPAPRPVISALRVGVLVKSSEKTGNNFVAPTNIQVLDVTVSGNDINDKSVHRLFTSTLALRNAM